MARTRIPEAWDDETEVLVAGLGAAGLAAAITAHEAGADVLVLEKTDEAGQGGNHRVSGQIWFSPTDVELAKVHLRSMAAEWPIPDDVVDAWAEETSKTTDWLLERLAALKGEWPRDPDDPYTGDGTDHVKMHFGALSMVAGTPDYEYPEAAGNEAGTENQFIDSMGSSRLWNMLRQVLRNTGVPVRYDARLVELIPDADGRVVGAWVSHADGGRSAIRATRGVVLATGNFAANQDLVRTYLRLSFASPLGSPTNTGDGLLAAQRLGAGLSHPYNYMQVPGVRIPELGIGEFAEPRDHRYIHVGADGRRFINEKIPIRHGKPYVRGTWDFTPSVAHWVIFDEDGRLAGPLAIPRAQYPIGWLKQVHRYDWSPDNSVEVEKGWIIRADTLGELADRLGIDAAGLEAEVETWNRAVERGQDTRFERPAETLRPIARGPFYGYRWGQVIISTLGGLSKNGDAQVLDVDGDPIAGLYAAGDVASTYTWALSGGMGIGDALAFGRIAGRAAAAH